MNGLIHRVFNIAPMQWSRVAECWLITFFFKIGSGIGWTVLTAAFVARFGIAFLPALFVVNALIIISGTWIFENFIMRMKREILMILMILLGAVCLFFASFFYDRSPVAFFALVIFAESMFLAQFNVFIPILVGDRFTPLESQKTFPFIESAETVGMMLGGTLVGVLASKLPIVWFVYIWIFALACVIFVFAGASAFRKTLPPLPFRVRGSYERESTFDQIKLVFGGIRKFPFLRSLVTIVFLQWVFMNVLELQYTKAMEQSVTRRNEPSLAFHIDPKLFQAAVMSSPEGIKKLPEIAGKNQNKALSGNEEILLTEKLGTWKGIFGAGALITQIFLASRLITSLGVVGSMLLHPIMLLMSLVGMFLKFGFLSSVIAKFNFETSLVVHKNAYFSSHYALPKFLRDQSAEFLEGMVRPMGTAVGMLVILAFQSFLAGRDLSLVTHIVMSGIMIAMLVSTIRLQGKYTAITKSQLFSNLAYPEKLGAIEILAQRGHDDSTIILMQKLQDGKNEPPVVRQNVIRALGVLRDDQSIPHLLDALSDCDPDVRLEAANALMNFHDIGEKFYSQAFSRFRMMETLKEVFRKENSATVRSAIIRLFSIMRQPETVPFLLNLLNDPANESRGDCLYTLGLFHDPATAYYIRPHLDSADHRVSASALTALWQFPAHRQELEARLNTLLSSENPEHVKAGIFVIGEVGLPKKILLREFLHSSSPEISLEASFALTKLADTAGLHYLLSKFLSSEPEEFDRLRHFFHRLRPHARRQADRFLHDVIAEMLMELEREYGKMPLQNVPQQLLERLRRLYTLVNQHEELSLIESVLYGSSHA